MALSDQLTRLATRAKEVEDRATAARARAKSDLQQEVKDARAKPPRPRPTRSTRTRRRPRVTSPSGGATSGATGRSRSSRSVATLTRIAPRTISSTREKAAQRADDDAAFAIDYVYAALAEAEYAVLDAYLAHMEADELADAASSS